jgi:hypothetical protein
LIEKAVVKPTKKGDGHYIELMLSILEGPAKGRKLWDRINIANPNTTCAEIGLRQLSALARAIGVMMVSDTSMLINKACIAHVKVNDEQNEIAHTPLTAMQLQFRPIRLRTIHRW